MSKKAGDAQGGTSRRVVGSPGSAGKSSDQTVAGGRGTRSKQSEESATDRVLSAIGTDAVDLLRGYLQEPLASTDLLVDDDTPLEHRMLVQAAVRYFIDEEDADDDTDSLVGFDDDASVVEAVAIAIGRAEALEDDLA